MKFQRNPLFFSKLIEGEWVLLKQNSAYCCQLNETAGFLWEQLDIPKSSADLLRSMINTYDVEKILAKNDLDSFLKKGLKHGFILSKN